MVEEVKTPENSEAQQTGISATFGAWDSGVEVEEVGQAVLDEATMRFSAPLQAAEAELYDDLCAVLEIAMEARLTPKGYRVALEELERMRNLAFARQALATNLALRMVPHLRVVDMEAYLQEALREAKLGTTESVDDFVAQCLGKEVDYVRQVLPDFPADWYKHDWAVAQIRERANKTQERFAAASAEAEGSDCRPNEGPITNPKSAPRLREESTPEVCTVRIDLTIESELWRGKPFPNEVTLRGPAAEMTLAALTVAMKAQPPDGDEA